jgi:hypothetical protein
MTANRQLGLRLRRSLWGALAVAGLLWNLLSPISSPAVTVVMRIVAAVNDTVLTSKDLADFMALQRMVPGPEGERSGEPADLLAQLIDQVLILQEASRRQIVAITKAEVDSEIRRRMALMGGERNWERRRKTLGIPEEEIRELVRRQLMARKYMDLRLRLFVQVTDEDIKEYYEQHRRELGNVPLERLRGQIEQLLSARKFNDRLREWTRELRDRASIRIPREDLKLVGISDVPLRELFPGTRNPSKEEKPEEVK